MCAVLSTMARGGGAALLLALVVFVGCATTVLSQRTFFIVTSTFYGTTTCGTLPGALFSQASFAASCTTNSTCDVVGGNSVQSGCQTTFPVLQGMVPQVFTLMGNNSNNGTGSTGGPNNAYIVAAAGGCMNVYANNTFAVSFQIFCSRLYGTATGNIFPLISCGGTPVAVSGTFPFALTYNSTVYTADCLFNVNSSAASALSLPTPLVVLATALVAVVVATFAQ